MATSQLQKIGKYDITEVLGEGGMGIVYKGVDPGIGRPVAIKMMTGNFADNPDLLKRFEREARSTGKLAHRNIVTIFELGTENGHPYMVIEYISGETLDQIITTRKRMSLVEKTEIMIQILEGLQYAHDNGIVHRDIKPGNVMLLKDGTVKILDFGIARISDNSMTKTGQIVGTINYMSPEQFNGHVVDGRSDIFSAGVLFYEFLTGVLPFDGAETPSVILKILNEPPPPLKDHIKDFPPELEEIVKKSLTKDREDRYASAGDFAFELSRLQETLKRDMVLEYVEAAKVALNKSELNKAKDLLQQVIKVDTKHVTARELMKEVQQQLSVQQRNEQIRHLRASAEDALANKHLDEAVSYAEQALKLDKSNAELTKLHQLVMQAKARKDLLDKTLRKAEHFREDGDLDAALHTAEEALALDPKDTSAKAVLDSVAAQIKKAQLQKELTEILDKARKEISAGHFTAALELIRTSEALSPGATQSGSLRNMLATSREQEQLRLAAEQTAIQVEKAFYKENSASAQQKIEAALKKYPGEPMLVELSQHGKEWHQYAGLGDVAKVAERARTLVSNENYEPAVALLEHACSAAPEEKLKSLLAEVSTAFAEVNNKASAVLVQAESLLKSEKVDQAVELLEAQSPAVARNARLYEVLLKARTQQDKLIHVESGILEARSLMEKGDLNNAWNKAKAMLQASPNSAQLQQFLKDMEGHRAAVAKEAIEKAIRDARSLMLARQSTAANRALRSVISYLNIVSPELQKAFEAMQRDVSSAGDTAPADADSNKTIVHGSAGTAKSATAAAVAPALSPRTIVQEPELPKKAPLPVKQIGAAVLGLVLVVGGYFGYKTVTAPPPVDSYIEINAVPWGKVTTIVSADGKITRDINKETPIRVLLPSGDYTVNLTGPDGKATSQKVTISKANPGIGVNQIFEGVSANEIVQSSN